MMSNLTLTLRTIERQDFVELPQILRCYNNIAPNVSRLPSHWLCIKLFKAQYLQNYPSKQDNQPLILKLVMSLTCHIQNVTKITKKRQII